MEFFQHEFENIEDYLHHRKPYLLLDEIVSIGEREIVTSVRITGDEFFSKGHFPGAPICPGALMQEMTTQSAGILIAAKFNPMSEFNTHDPFFNEYALGVLVKVNRAKYRGFARPGDTLKISVTLNERVAQNFDFGGEIWVGDRKIMSNEFQLANISSKVLQGVDRI